MIERNIQEHFDIQLSGIRSWYNHEQLGLVTIRHQSSKENLD